MNKQLLKDGLGWGFILWLIGYALGNWLSIAVVGDYLLIVKAFNPTDGYYKLDVYIYYALTVAIPVIAGWRRTTRRS